MKQYECDEYPTGSPLSLGKIISTWDSFSDEMLNLGECNYLIWLSVKSTFFHKEVIITGTSWQDSEKNKHKYKQ